ncbi:maleylacetoacetate isomerase [Neofusicoccum parvum]|uniref:Maleylacetoacetate isomerase n=1 Tax=Neofusicoccum parvum TaxID=310453 RepID=A0ACB5SBV9_9PEZI|nr:maleylacetoacetate isomerase [Neofusicoccum parvum]
MATTTTTATKQDDTPSLHLHTYFRSSCSARLRIALRLKRLPHTSTPVHLLRAEQTSASYLALNPSGTVPTLTHTITHAHTSPIRTTTNNNPFPAHTITITQSIAALEYLEEAFPSTRRLLPPPASPAARAAVRTLVGIIACDIQPLTNSKPIKAVNALGHDGQAWARDWTERGLDAFEAALARTQDPAAGGRFSVGEEVTLADVCLVPAVWAARRWGCAVERWPRVMGVVGWMEGLEEVRAAHWRRQEDTPEEFRGEE